MRGPPALSILPKRTTRPGSDRFCRKPSPSQRPRGPGDHATWIAQLRNRRPSGIDRQGAHRDLGHHAELVQLDGDPREFLARDRVQVRRARRNLGSRRHRIALDRTLAGIPLQQLKPGGLRLASPFYRSFLKQYSDERRSPVQSPPMLTPPRHNSAGEQRKLSDGLRSAVF